MYFYLEQEKYEEKLSEAYCEYKEKTRDKIEIILDNIIKMVGGIGLYENGYNMRNNIDTYTIVSEELYVELISDDEDNSKIIEYTIR